MTDLRYYAEQIGGMWAMAIGRPAWRDRLDRSTDGVFRSFWALVPALIITLIFAAYVHANPALIEDATGLTQSGTLTVPSLPLWLIMETLHLVVSWGAGLWIVVFSGTRLEGRHAAADLIVGYNWLQLVFRVALIFPMALFIITGTRGVAGLVVIPIVGLSVFLHWGVLRRAIPSANWSAIIGLMLAILFAILITGTVVTSLFSMAQPAASG